MAKASVLLMPDDKDLQSDQVKRLFAQPNLVIRRIPAKNSEAQSAELLKQSSNLELSPSISIFSNSTNDEISLEKVFKSSKSCGHENCENLISEVIVNFNDALPMIAKVIEDQECDSKVTKHCENKNCDALSIDHDRCRKICVKLHRFSENYQTNICDICKVPLKSKKVLLRHKNCEKKDLYVHNNADPAKILKDKLRERELQLIQDAKLRKNEILDPIEALKRNKEIIIIPKIVGNLQACSQSVDSEHSIFGSNYSSFQTDGSNLNFHQNCRTSSRMGPDNLHNSSENIPGSTLSRLAMGNSLTVNLISKASQQVSQVKSPDLLNGGLVTSAACQQTGQSFSMLNSFAEAHVNPFYEVPIKTFLSAPSQLHCTQGEQKYCIISREALSVRNPPTEFSAVNSVSSTPKKSSENTLLENLDMKLSRKKFQCNICQKRFTTKWYFKVHVARHTGEKKGRASKKLGKCNEF